MDKFFVELFQNNKLDSFLDYFMIILTKMGDGPFFIIVLLIMLFIKKTRILSLLLATSYASTALIVSIIKNLVMRERPFITYNIDILINEPHGTSFPSGHSATSFALLGLFFFIFYKNENKKLRILSYLALVLASLIAFSRVYLTVHYFSDILAGAILGLTVALIINSIIKRGLKDVL